VLAPAGIVTLMVELQGPVGLVANVPWGELELRVTVVLLTGLSGVPVPS
jgi:hypothetical protein